MLNLLNQVLKGLIEKNTSRDGNCRVSWGAFGRTGASWGFWRRLFFPRSPGLSLLLKHGSKAFFISFKRSQAKNTNQAWNGWGIRHLINTSGVVLTAVSEEPGVFVVFCVGIVVPLCFYVTCSKKRSRSILTVWAIGFDEVLCFSRLQTHKEALSKALLFPTRGRWVWYIIWDLILHPEYSNFPIIGGERGYSVSFRVKPFGLWVFNFAARPMK